MLEDAGNSEKYHESALCAQPDVQMCMRSTIDIPDALAAEVRERRLRAIPAFAYTEPVVA